MRSTLLPNSFYLRERKMGYFIQLKRASGIRYVFPFENNRKSFVFDGAVELCLKVVYIFGIR
jgi:hypothetical protein